MIIDLPTPSNDSPAFLARVSSTIKDADFYSEFAKGQIDYCEACGAILL